MELYTEQGNIFILPLLYPSPHHIFVPSMLSSSRPHNGPSPSTQSSHQSSIPIMNPPTPTSARAAASAGTKIPTEMKMNRHHHIPSMVTSTLQSTTTTSYSTSAASASTIASVTSPPVIIPPLLHHPPPPSQPVQHNFAPKQPRRPTSASLRRKLQALEPRSMTARTNPSSHHHAGGTHGNGSSRSGSRAHSRHDSSDMANNRSRHTGLPPSILPASAYEYTRLPPTNFIVALPQLAANGEQRDWETLTFPSANPAISTGVSGGELEVDKLTSWFDHTWTQLEQNVQLRAVKAKRAQMRLAGREYQSIDGDLNPALTNPDEKSSSSSLIASHDPTAATPILSPAMLHELDLAREKLCFIVFHELLRHVTGTCRRRGALLEKIWMSHQRLTERRLAYRMDEIIATSEANSQRTIQRMTNEFEEILRREKATQIQSQVDATYLNAELEAKERIIHNLQQENDKDLLYSNQIVCHKEMAYLKLERDSKSLQSENMKLHDDLKYLSDDKRQLEDSFAKLEDEKDELQLQSRHLQQLLDQRMRTKLTQSTQYDVRDAPPEPSTEEKRRTRAAVMIQRLFRGFRTRRKLKVQGLLSRRVILKKLHQLRLASVSTMNAGSGAGVGVGSLSSSSSSPIDGHSGGNGTINMFVPSVPRGFRHLMNEEDMQLNREHFIRWFTHKNLLKWIQKLYVEKSIQDQRYQHAVKHRKDFPEFVYDYYLLKHGARDAAEMDMVRSEQSRAEKLNRNDLCICSPFNFSFCFAFFLSSYSWTSSRVLTRIFIYPLAFASSTCSSKTVFVTERLSPDIRSRAATIRRLSAARSLSLVTTSRRIRTLICSSIKVRRLLPSIANAPWRRRNNFITVTRRTKAAKCTS